MSGQKTKIHANFKTVTDDNGKVRIQAGPSKKQSVSERIRKQRSKRVKVVKRK